MQYVFGYAPVTMNEVAKMLRGEYVTQKSMKAGDIPVILGGTEPAYYADRSNHSGEVIVVSRSGANAGFVSFWNEDIFVSDGFMLETNDNCKIRYLYHVLKSQQEKLHEMKRGAGVPHVRGDEIMKINFLLPSINRQKEMVSILDRFDSLCNDFESGIPAEIEARKKQYEYYRDMLLSFNEK